MNDLEDFRIWLMHKDMLLTGKLPDLEMMDKLLIECVKWNRACPIGTEVIYHPTIGQPPGIRTKTASEARIFHLHTAVIDIEAPPGFVPLEALEPVGVVSDATEVQLTPEL